MRPHWLPIVASCLAAAAVLCGCSTPYYAPPMETRWSAPQEPPIDIEKLVPKQDFQRVKDAFREAYGKQAKPRLVFLVNRQFEVKEEKALQPKAAVDIEGKREDRPREPDAKGGTVATDSERITLYERRADQTRDPARVHQMAYEHIEAELKRPFRELDCIVLDPDLPAEGVPDPVMPLNLAKLRERADILVLVRTECSRAYEFGQTLHRVRFAGRALDVRNSRDLAHVVRTAESLELETTAGTDYFRLSREDLVRGTRRLAYALMDQVAATWERGNTYTLVVQNLTSETQLRHVTDHMRKNHLVRRVDVRKSRFSEKEGEAEVQVEFGGPPDELVKWLRNPQAFTGFRLEVAARAYTEFLVTVVPT